MFRWWNDNSIQADDFQKETLEKHAKFMIRYYGIKKGATSGEMKKLAGGIWWSGWFEIGKAI